MNPADLAAYNQARQRVLDAQADLPTNVEELAAAHQELRAAEEPVATELQLAWQANIDAIQAATLTLRQAVAEQARVETEAGTAARARNPTQPVLTVEEVAACTAAAAAADAARQALVETQVAFKAGVTVEQLEAVT